MVDDGFALTLDDGSQAQRPGHRARAHGATVDPGPRSAGTAGVQLLEGEVEALVGPEGVLDDVRLVDGAVVPFEALVVAARMLAWLREGY